jgi:hypothetical protein
MTKTASNTSTLAPAIIKLETITAVIMIIPPMVGVPAFFKCL